MPKDNIERAVKKAIGGEGENYDEIRYEGYGPGGVAVIVEALTDNRNRAASDIRSFFTKSGGNLGETGSVSFMFDHTGIIEYDASVASDDAMLDAAIEAGADDVVSSESGHEIYASQETFREVAKALEAKFGEAAQGGADLEAAQHRAGGRRDRREAVEADRPPERARRRAERLRQFRGIGRADGEDGRVSRDVIARTPLSSPGLTGRSSIPETLVIDGEAAAYWIPSVLFRRAYIWRPLARFTSLAMTREGGLSPG